MKTQLLEQLDRYQSRLPNESAQQQIVLQFQNLLDDPKPWLRDNYLPGHLTGAAVILCPDRRNVLLTHHRKLNLWLQVGGHWEPGDATLQETALREAREESGLKHLEWIDGGEIIDLDVHHIPGRGSEPPHLHFDVRYALEGNPGEPPKLSEESVEVRWFSLPEARKVVNEESLLRVFDKMAP